MNSHLPEVSRDRGSSGLSEPPTTPSPTHAVRPTATRRKSGTEVYFCQSQAGSLGEKGLRGDPPPFNLLLCKGWQSFGVRTVAAQNFGGKRYPEVKRGGMGTGSPVLGYRESVHPNKNRIHSPRKGSQKENLNLSPYPHFLPRGGDNETQALPPGWPFLCVDGGTGSLGGPSRPVG